MPRRNSFRVDPIRLGGKEARRDKTARVVSLDAVDHRKLVADAVEEVVTNWVSIAAALELTSDEATVLGLKVAGMPRASMATHLGWSQKAVERVRKALETKLSGAPLHGKRSKFEQIRLRGQSCAPFHTELVAGVERIALDHLDEENFADVMRRECPQPVEVKNITSQKCFFGR